MNEGRVIEINGPLVQALLPGIANGEQVRVGELNLTGEVIGLNGDRALVQVYETTEMLRPGDTVIPLGHPFSVELGPGLLGGIFDGIQRPLQELMEASGDHIPRGPRGGQPRPHAQVGVYAQPGPQGRQRDRRRRRTGHCPGDRGAGTPHPGAAGDER